jgi:hypothetical protein
MNPWDEFFDLRFMHMRLGGKTPEEANRLAWHQAVENAKDSAEEVCVRGLRNVIADDTKPQD